MTAEPTSSEAAGNALTHPFEILGVGTDADEATVRARYLELVRQYPPDRDPDMFSKIRAAYEAATNPIIMARRILEVVQAGPRPWAELLDEQSQRPPRLPHELLLSLGNRSQPDKPKPTDESASDSSANMTSDS
ncbi:J domain-containing protein [Allorhodopirellula solitaria]|nr:J domain-containing protein [Allorhodopirellula solitaria]